MANNAAVLATLDGFAVEGDYDAAGCPATAHWAASALGMCASPGDAAGLWRPGRYESTLAALSNLGLDGVRVTLEWARLEPHQGQRNAAALQRYREVLDGARRLGLRATVVLVDATWPAWLGQEAWLLPWVEPVAEEHIQYVMDGVADLVDAIVPFARAKELVERGFIAGTAPPWRHGASDDAAAARAAVTRIAHKAREIVINAGLELPRYREVLAVSSPEAVEVLLHQAVGVDEIHVRSLVRGFGPTAAPGALLDADGENWRVAVPPGVISLLAN